jgi:predicted nucleic acid-binding protein
MGKKYLIDSNVIIDYLDNKLPKTGMDFMSKVINDSPYISVISQIEVLRYNLPPQASLIMNAFVDYCSVCQLDKEIVPIVIDICKQSKIKLPDAIIAATAIYNKLVLLTRNINDFKNIDSLTCVNPHQIG